MSSDTQIVSGRESVYGTEAMLLPECSLHAVQAVAWVALLVTVVLAFLYLKDGEAHRPYVTKLLMGLWAFWVLVPPIWFSYEYFYLFKETPNNVPFETFKYGQDTAAKAWLGIAAVLTGILKK